MCTFSERPRFQPINSLMRNMAKMTSAIFPLYQTIFLFRHGVQLRQIMASSISFATCTALLKQNQPRELRAPCLILGYIVWNLLPGMFALFDLPSHPAFMRDLHTKDQPRKCIVR
jgi:hypothetical protein